MSFETGTSIDLTESTVGAIAAGSAWGLRFRGTWETSATSTLDCRGIDLAPTINFAHGTPGAGRVQLIRLAPVNTALPTGLSGALVLAATASALGGLHFHNQTDEATNYEYVKLAFISDILTLASYKGGTGTLRGIQIGISGNSLGFFGATPAAKPTGVAVSAAGIHAALVTLGLIGV